MVDTDTQAILDATTESAKKLASGFEEIANMAGLGNFFSDISIGAKAIGVQFESVNSLTQKQSIAFSALTGSLLKTKSAFDSFGDTRGLNTFTSQIEKLKESVQGTSQDVRFKQFISSIGDNAKKFGVDLGKTAENIEDFGMKILKNADNALKLQNGLIQLYAKTGNLKELHKLAGGELENINNLLLTHSEAILQASEVTGVGVDTVESYYASLGSIPGALNAQVRGIGGATEHTNMLIATMRVATGTGRSFEEVVRDLSEAYQTYGLVGEQALKFSAEISEVTQNLKVPFDTVRSALMANASAFQSFANTGESASRMASGMATILNKYADALKSTGLNGVQAVAIVKDMTDKISGLTIAQKAFLSAQTGGPGGLMGGMQIEKMLREGKVSEVFEMVRKQMTKQFGSIATLEEAASSPAAAARLTAQRAMLMQGPLGQFAKSETDATRILESFKLVQEGKLKPEALKETVLEDTMKTGQDIQAKSYTVLNKMSTDIERIRRVAEVNALNVIQASGLTAGSGTSLGIEAEGAKLTDPTSAIAKNRMAAKAGMDPKKFADTLSVHYASKFGVNQEMGGVQQVAAAKGIGSVLGTVPSMASGPVELFSRMLKEGSIKDPVKELSKMRERIAEQKKNMAGLSPEQQKKLLEDEQAAVFIDSEIKKYYKEQGQSAPGMVGSAATAAGPKVAAAKAKKAASAGGAGSTEEAHAMEHKVKIEGICLICHRKSINDHTGAVSPGAAAAIP